MFDRVFNRFFCDKNNMCKKGGNYQSYYKGKVQTIFINIDNNPIDDSCYDSWDNSREFKPAYQAIFFKGITIAHGLFPFLSSKDICDNYKRK